VPPSSAILHALTSASAGKATGRAPAAATTLASTTTASPRLSASGYCLPSHYVESLLVDGMYMQVFVAALKDSSAANSEDKDSTRQVDSGLQQEQEQEKEEEEDGGLDRFKALTRSDTYTHSQLEAINAEFSQYLYDPPDGADGAHGPAHHASSNINSNSSIDSSGTGDSSARAPEIACAYLCETCISAAGKSRYSMQLHSGSGRNTGKPLSLSDMFGSPLKAEEMTGSGSGSGSSSSSGSGYHSSSMVPGAAPPPAPRFHHFSEPSRRLQVAPRHTAAPVTQPAWHLFE